jgi:hypothetical protein
MAPLGRCCKDIQMKTTVDIADALLARARRHAKKTRRPVRALIEEGLRRVLDDAEASHSYRLPDRSAGRAGEPNPLEALSWSDLRSEIYGNR